MKRILFLAVLFSVMISAAAQYRDVVLPEKPSKTAYKDYNGEETGFWCAVELEGGSSVMQHKTNAQFAGLTWTGGYRFNEYLRVGAGVGGKWYVHNAGIRDTKDKFGFPIFANVRGNFISAYHRDGVPFWSVNVGGITQEGFFANPVVGYSFGGLRNNFQIGLSYTLSCFKNCAKENTTYSYLGIKLGYEF